MDWGQAGLLETLETLDETGIAHAGAGQVTVRRFSSRPQL
jgi:hypothetical protein